MADEKIDWSKKTWADLDLFGVGVADPYLFKGAAPLDSRLVIKEYNYLEGLKVKDIAYPGMIVYVKDKQSHYTYTGTAWEPFSGDSAPDANADTQGIVKLSDAVNSDLGAASGVTAATPAAVKAAYDKANHTHPYLLDTTKYAGSSTKGGVATNAVNVTTNINGKAISSIFESNGTTVKSATNAESANKVANALTIKLNDSATNEGTDKFTYDGSIAKTVTIKTTDADIKLSAPFTITKDFGWYTIPSGQTFTTVGEKGQSLRSFLEGAFGSEDTTIFSTTPSCSININNAGSYEMGSTITPTATWTTDAGTYKYGTYGTVTTAASSADFVNKLTGITYSNKSITFKNGSSTITSLTLTATTTISATGSATRSAVTNRPCSNLGKDLYDELASEYKSSKAVAPTDSDTFTPYRAFFYGAVTVDPTSTNLTSTVIRGLTNGGNYASAQSFNITAEDFIPDGDNRPESPDNYLKAFIIAIPNSNSRSRISKVTSTTGMVVDVTSAYTKASFNVPVADARGGSTNTANYDIYIWNPASIGAAVNHKVELA